MIEPALTVTLLYVGLNALIALVLAALCVRARVQTKTDIGPGEDVRMVRAVRAHGNNAEYVPLALILIGALELAGGGPLLLHGLGIALTVGRLLHAQGLYQTLGTSPGRFAGTVLTWTVYLVGGAASIYFFFA